MNLNFFYHFSGVMSDSFFLFWSLTNLIKLNENKLFYQHYGPPKTSNEEFKKKIKNKQTNDNLNLVTSEWQSFILIYNHLHWFTASYTLNTVSFSQTHIGQRKREITVADKYNNGYELTKWNKWTTISY